MPLHEGEIPDIAYALEQLRMARSDPRSAKTNAEFRVQDPDLPPAQRALFLGVIAKVDIEHDDITSAVANAEAAWRALPDPAPGVVVGELAALLANALTLSNRPHDAVALLDSAERRPGASDSGLVDLQRAAVLYRLGAMEQALGVIDRAVDRFGSPALIERARALNNRGIIRLYLGELDGGWDDFTESESIYRGAGLHRAAAETVHNRSMIHARRGDIPRALADFHAAEAELLGLRCPIDAQIVARSEVLVQARLYDDVIELLPPIIDRMAAAQMHADADEGRVYVAQSKLALGVHGAAGEVEELAESFRERGRVGWAAVLEDLALEARLARDESRSVTVEHAIA